jgi:hypothetical protein
MTEKKSTQIILTFLFLFTVEDCFYALQHKTNEAIALDRQTSGEFRLDHNTRAY